MARTFLKHTGYAAFALLMLTLTGFHAAAQSTPDVPASDSFGGITVKFDRSAQNIIDEDIKSLMGNKKFWEEKMDRAILHFPIVEGILMDEEVPIDFKYLAVQESSFRPDVISTSNAVGYWQMKPETARELNLQVDDNIDERKNISSSTHAAAWYLKRNNQQFNNWVTTLYSYYQGAGGVKKVIPASWAYAREVTLSGKTDRYVLRFFAHKIALEAGIERYKSGNAMVLLESDYGKGKTLDEIASNLGVSAADLKSYNRWLIQDKVPGDKEYLIAIPVPLSQVAAVREKLSLPPSQTQVASVYEDTGYPVLKKSASKSKDPNAPARYEINGLPGVEARAGDKAKTLAKEGDISAPKFMRYNDMVADMPLIPGKVYYLAKKNKKAATPFHTARPGDTWHSVSQQYGIRLVSLLKYNRTTSKNYPIQTGQVLFLTKKRPKKQPIEIIAPPQPATAQPQPAVAAAANAAEPVTTPAATAASGIPDKPSGRKKYTPVLVEKTDNAATESASKPVATAPVAKPMVTPAANASTAKTPASASETNDRVVIITQDNTDASFRAAEEEDKMERKANAPSKVITPNDTRTTATNSVYLRQKAAAEEKAARERETASARNTASPVAAPAARSAYHTVQSGETYFSIANKYGLTLRELLAINDKDSRSRLVSGQKLLVSKEGLDEIGKTPEAAETKVPERVAVTRPDAATTFKTPEETRAEVKSANPDVEYHTVQSGQTYYSISKTYGLSIRELLALNNLSDSDGLKSGQRLRVRQSEDAGTANISTSPATSQTHTVAPGETLFRIAQTYGTNISDIKKLNNMSGNSVMVGQKLKIPQQ